MSPILILIQRISPLMMKRESWPNLKDTRLLLILAGNTTARLQNALDFYLVQGSALEVSMEFIVVEWNPLPAEERLKDVLKVPPGCVIPVRVITVGPEFHSRVSAGTGQSFFNEIAKNVGARRSRSESTYALCWLGLLVHFLQSSNPL